MNELTIDLTAILSEAQRRESSSFVDRFVDELGHTSGIRATRIITDDIRLPVKLSVEYDPKTVSNDEIQQLAITIGDRVSSRQNNAPSASAHSNHTHAGCDHQHGGVFGPRTEIMFAALCGVTLLTGWIIGRFTGLPTWTAGTLLAFSYFFGGTYPVLEAVEKIRAGKFEIDFLMIVAAAGAAALGAYAEGALLLFLFSTGHSLESYAMGRAKRAIEALADLAPRTARVRRNERELEISVDELRVGDIVVIKPDERVPADGFVVLGESSVDQAPITGESIPVDKSPVPNSDVAKANPETIAQSHRVYAGTINQAGALEVFATKTSAENMLSRVVTLVSEAETRASPTQQFAKRFEKYFVPSVIAGVILLLCAPLIIDEPFSASFYRAMAVLVAASPCALAIATPSAVLSGVARAARSGILVKGGAPLENLGRIDSIAFDKTGTLTEGKPKITDVVTLDGFDEPTWLRAAIAVERLSKHPLAKAVVRDGQLRLQERGVSHDELPEATQLKSITGRGIQATLQDSSVEIGKLGLFEHLSGTPITDAVRDAVTSLEKAGRTTMVVRLNGQYAGIIGLMDTPRESAKRTIEHLRKLGVARMVMISGDNQQVADAVAREVGLDEGRGNLMPEDKVATVRAMDSTGGVAMVGDGVNDAPAMASASVGIAMGAAGSDVALETADIALMADALDNLPLAIGLGRETSRIIRQNLWISLGMVAFLVPATILGLSLGPAVILHEGSTLVVVTNALRLLAYKQA